MTADRRFPYMERVRDGVSRVDEGPRRKLRRVARSVEGRTGCTVWLNHKLGSLQCSDGDDLNVLYCTPNNQVFGPGGSIMIPDADEMVRHIQQSRWESMEAKLKRLERAKKDADDRVQSETEKLNDTFGREAGARAKHTLNKIRHGEHSRPSVLV